MTFTIVTSVLYLILMLILNAQLPVYDKLSAAEKKAKVSKSIVIFVIGLAFLIRFIFASVTKGHSTDMNCWMGWANNLVENGAWGFYSNSSFADYPPGYMYILWFIGGIVKLFNFHEPFVWTMYKLPAIIADIYLAYTVYKIAEKELNAKIGMILLIAIAFNPLLYFNSTIWGQMDSVLILFLVLSLYAVYEEKYYKSVIFFAIAAFIKPQAFMLLPLIVVLFLKKKDYLMFVKAVVVGIGLAIILSIPFSPVWVDTDYNVLQKIILSFNPVWLIEKYITTLSSYKYATVNAFNLYAMFEGNWQPLENRFVFLTYNAWGTIAIIVGAVFSMFMAFKVKNKGNAAFLSSFFLIAFLFVFATKMHERYLIPAIVFIIMGYIFTKDRRFLGMFTLLSVVNLFNVGFIFKSIMDDPKAMPDMNWVGPISIVQVAVILVSIGIVLKVCFSKNTLEETKDKKLLNINQFESMGNFLGIRYNKKENRDILKEPKMVKWDYIMMAVITLAYSCVAFTKLGDMEAPQTFCKFNNANESFVVEFEKTEIISSYAYYDGIGKVSDKPHLEVEYSVDGVNWQKYGDMATLNSVFRWEIPKLEPNIEARYLRATVPNPDYRIFEMAFRNTDESLIKIKSVSGDTNADYSAMFDEQQYVPVAPTYMNGTYFDEIYHPRTAYEHLHLMPYYETTHPPLGKLIMSVGIAIFGMTPFGWRFTGTLFGCMMLPVFYIFLKKIFGRTRYASIGTFLFAVDFMHLSLTRLGTIDSYPVFFIILMYYFMYTFARRTLYFVSIDGGNFFKKENKKKIILPLILSGISFGLGVSSKWIGAYAGAGLFIEFIIIMWMVYSKLPNNKKKAYNKFFWQICAWCMGFFVLIPLAIYTASYIPISMVDGYKNAFAEMWKNQEYMLKYHGNLKSTHPYSSKWYQWVVDKKPLWAYQMNKNFRPEDTVATISIFGNPILYWAGFVAMFYTLISGIKQKSKTVLFIVIAFLAQFLPWILISRTTYMYHYFASVPFMIIMLVYAIRELECKHKYFKYVTYAFCLVCLAMFIMFYPVLTGMIVSKDYVDMYLRWFKSWVFYN